MQIIPQKTENMQASNGGESVNTDMGAVPLKGTPYAVKQNRFMSPLGIPCSKRHSARLRMKMLIGMPKTGKQYMLISAGGARQSPGRGDYVIAYALDH